MFHGCSERRAHGHELLFRSWTKLEHVAREKSEAQMPNEFSRERRQINLSSRKSLTLKPGITCLSLFFSPVPVDLSFFFPVHTSGSLCTFSQSIPAH